MPVFDSNFEDCKSGTGDLIARKLSALEAIDEGLEVVADLPIALCQTAQLRFEFSGKLNLDGRRFTYQCRPRAVRGGRLGLL